MKYFFEGVASVLVACAIGVLVPAIFWACAAFVQWDIRIQNPWALRLGFLIPFLLCMAYYIGTWLDKYKMLDENELTDEDVQELAAAGKIDITPYEEMTREELIAHAEAADLHHIEHHDREKALLADKARMDWLEGNEVHVLTRGENARIENIVAMPGLVRNSIDFHVHGELEATAEDYAAMEDAGEDDEQEEHEDAIGNSPTVTLQYFKESGKYYTHGEYNTVLLYPWDVCREVRDMRSNGKLPGLAEGAGKEFDIYCTFKGIPYLLKKIHNERPEGA